MLEKQIVIDKVEVLEDGQIQIRQATKIMENGKEISKTYHRWVLSPGQNVDNQTDKVKAIANASWTEEVVSAFEAKQAENITPEEK